MHIGTQPHLTRVEQPRHDRLGKPTSARAYKAEEASHMRAQAQHAAATWPGFPSTRPPGQGFWHCLRRRMSPTSPASSHLRAEPCRDWSTDLLNSQDHIVKTDSTLCLGAPMQTFFASRMSPTAYTLSSVRNARDEFDATCSTVANLTRRALGHSQCRGSPNASKLPRYTTQGSAPARSRLQTTREHDRHA